MEHFDIRGEVNVLQGEVTIATVVDGVTVAVKRDGLIVRDLLIGGKRVPTSAFERIPEEPLAGEPLGHVNWWFGDNSYCYERGYRQLVWVNASGEARRTIVSKLPPAGIDPIAWKAQYEQFSRLPHLFLDD